MPDPKPKRTPNGALTEPPPRDEYDYVLRRHDREPERPWRLAMYHRTAVARCIEHPDGKVCATLFLKDKGPGKDLERKAAMRRGWRDDVTALWAAHAVDDQGNPAEVHVDGQSVVKGSVKDAKKRISTLVGGRGEHALPQLRAAREHETKTTARKTLLSELDRYIEMLSEGGEE